MIGPRRDRDWWEARGSLVPWWCKVGVVTLVAVALGVLVWK